MWPDRRQSQAVRHWSFNMGRLVTVGLLALAAISLGTVWFTVIGEPDTTGPVYLTLINVNLLVAVVFGLFVGRQVILLFLDRRGRLKRARLHVRLLAIFTVLAVLPTLFVAVFAIFVLNQGLESWFSNRVSRALEGSLQVAQAYLSEHEKTLLVETQAMAQDPTVTDPTFMLDYDAMRQVLLHEVEERGLDELAVYDQRGGLVVAAGSLGAYSLSVDVQETLQLAPKKAIAIRNISANQVTVVAPLSGDRWLVASRWLDPTVTARVDQTQAAFQEYYGLRKNRSQIRWVFTLFLVVMAIASLAGAIWAGLRLATRIVRPVTALVHATNRVSAGDLEVRVPPVDDDEIGILTQSFNRMAQQLKSGRDLLEKKNKELDERRRTMEALLTGVSAGVLSLDEEGIIRSANKTAQKTLNLKTGVKIGEVDPSLGALFEEFLEAPKDLFQQQVRIAHKEGESQTLLVRMVPQRTGGGRLAAVVVTFDDITPLISAQKVAAWADVAQRLAHEIKNPLTPIQLSAERLKRKYLDKLKVKEEQQLFAQLTDTIVRQTEEMRRMTNEFSDFARMPTAQMAPESLLDIVQEVLVLQQTGRDDIRFEQEIDVPEKAAQLYCDRSHITRLLTNVVENAVNAIHEREQNSDKEEIVQGEVKIVVKMPQDDTLAVSVLDNGRGLPEDVEIEQLFDPYITTRKKGTGLGLAIVRRVMDEHGGQVRLTRRPEGGTAIELIFPVNKDKRNDHDNQHQRTAT